MEVNIINACSTNTTYPLAADAPSTSGRSNTSSPLVSDAPSISRSTSNSVSATNRESSLVDNATTTSASKSVRSNSFAQTLPSEILSVNSPLNLLASTASALLEQNSLSISLDQLVECLSGHPRETVQNIYRKALQYINDPKSISNALGCNPKDRILSSSSAKGKFHHVIAGEKEGDYRCDKICIHWKATKMCSHTIRG